MDELDATVARGVAESKRQRYSGAEDPVFAVQKGRSAGKPISDNTVVKQVFDPLWKRSDLKLPQLTWHVFRHTHASFTATLGANVHDRRALTGHASVSTLDLYTHADLERLRAITTDLSNRIWFDSDQQLTNGEGEVLETTGVIQ